MAQWRQGFIPLPGLVFTGREAGLARALTPPLSLASELTGQGVPSQCGSTMRSSTRSVATSTGDRSTLGSASVKTIPPSPAGWRLSHLGGCHTVGHEVEGPRSRTACVLTWLSLWLSNHLPASGALPRRARFTRGNLEGRLGFEPRTRGLKVPCSAAELPALMRLCTFTLGLSR